MTQRRIPGTLLALLLLCGPGFGQETKELTLTLEDSIVRALKNNLNVAAEVINPGLASASVSQARQMYTPTLQFDLNRNRTNRPPPGLSRRTKPTSTRRRARLRRSPRRSPSAAPCKPP